jgi:hypothetical protein
LGSCSFKIQIVKNEVDINQLMGEGNQSIFERTARIPLAKIGGHLGVSSPEARPKTSNLSPEAVIASYRMVPFLRETLIK